MELESVNVEESTTVRWEEYSRETESESKWNGRLVALQPRTEGNTLVRWEEYRHGADAGRSAPVRWEEYRHGASRVV